ALLLLQERHVWAGKLVDLTLVDPDIIPQVGQDNIALVAQRRSVLRRNGWTPLDGRIRLVADAARRIEHQLAATGPSAVVQSRKRLLAVLVVNPDQIVASASGQPSLPHLVDVGRQQRIGRLT